MKYCFFNKKYAYLSKVGVYMLIINLAVISFVSVYGSVDGYAVSSIPMDIPVPELRSAVLDIGVANEIPAYNDAVALERAVSYDDIRGVLNEQQIIKMAALGILKNRGNKNFDPSRDVTKFEALKYLDRLMGLGDTVEETAISNASGLSEGSVDALYDEAYAQIAIDNGILNNDEYIQMNEPITREQFAMWLSSAINIAPVYGDMDRIFGLDDYMEIIPANRAMVEALLREGIMSSTNDGLFHPKHYISRAECMGILDKALKTQYDKRKIKTGYGLVVGIKNENEQKVGYTIHKTNYIIRNVDGSVTKISTVNNPHMNKKTDFVVYKAGIQKMASAITLGDELYYISKDDELVYAQMPTDNSVMDKIRLTEQEGKDLTVYFGTVYEIVTQNHVTDDAYTNSKRYRVQTFNGQTFDIVVDTDIYTGVKNDIIVQKNNKIAGTDMLVEGDVISFIVKNNKDIVYISTQPFWEKTIKGTLRKITNVPKSPTSKIIDHRIIEIFGYDDVIYEYNIANYASVSINGITADYSDLRYGQNVILSIKQGYVMSIAGESFKKKDGYIPKFGKSRTGILYRVYQDGFVIDTGINKEEYDLTDDAIITKGGVPITYQALRDGDKIRIFFDDIYTNKISKMEVEGIKRVIKKIYKGQLADVDMAQNEITLTGVRYLKNDYWEPTSSYTQNFPLSDNVSIYAGNISVKPSELKRHYHDKTAYVMVEEVFGKPVASQVSLKSGGENIYSSKVKDINKVLSRLELDNNINFDITKATIAIKNGRAISPKTIKKYDNIMVVSDFSVGETRANIIKVLDKKERVFDRIYVGVIETVAQNYFTTKYWSRLNDNSWDDVDAGLSDKFHYHTSSHIVDVTDKENVKNIRMSDFFHHGYGRLENTATKQSEGSNKGIKDKRYYTLFVTKSNDRGELSVVSMKLRHKGFLPNQDIDDKIKKYSQTAKVLDDVLDDMFLTRGVVSEVDDKWKRIKLTDTNDWVISANEWRINESDSYVEYPEALFIKGDNATTLDDVKIGDEVYILRNNEKAQVIFIGED